MIYFIILIYLIDFHPSGHELQILNFNIYTTDYNDTENKKTAIK